MLGTVPEGVVWAVFFLPLASLVAIITLPRSQARLAGHITAAAVGASLLLSLWVLDSVIQTDGARLDFATHEWLALGPLRINVGLNVDGLTAVMLLVVTAVSFLVQVYSQGYMAGDGGYWRYFAYMSLFTMSMLGLVLADNLVLIYVFWEMVGLCSYLLIGFWFHKPEAAAAAKKAFLVTRLGDIGFLLAILLIFAKLETFDVVEIQELALGGALTSTVVTLFALGVFAGAAGKSAQAPLHVWLPDAMEGPTPVSALIHAATMVAAGVYLVARLFPVFHAAPDAMTVVGAVGGVTAIGAALIGLVMTDIKRVLAYSTISQLGYMMLALGVGAYVAAIFHLFTHAFFKALLFLGSGSVNHATNTFDMRLMGGLRRTMPITFVTFLIGSLSLAGVFPLAGFWSKDEILSDAWAHEKYLFFIALGTAGLTAFYMFRAIFMTFAGEYRGGAEPQDGRSGSAAEHGAHTAGPPAAHHAARPHESPPVMTLPLVILAVPAVIAGLANAGFLDKGLETLLVHALPADLQSEIEHSEFRIGVALVSTAVALAGIAIAWAVYSAKLISAERLRSALRPVHQLLENKYYLDFLYERVAVTWGFYRYLGGALSWVDSVIVDGAANGAGRLVRSTGGALRYVQNGQFQTYGLVAFATLVFAAILVLALNPL
jgi:NADH-quinone oxidoreductase subunit L